MRQELRYAQSIYWFDDERCADFDPAFFTLDFWQQKGEVRATASGRGSSWFIDSGQKRWVLRYYRRGGMIGKLLYDTYLYKSVARARSISEYWLLEQMLQKELPVPRPVAAKISRYGVCYRAAILLEQIPNSENLFSLLQQHNQRGTLANAIWSEIGRVIARFHAQGVDHADLNCHNILIDSNSKVWLVDFDKSSCKSYGNGKWAKRNLARLLRSLHKESNKGNFTFNPEQEWEMLITAYKQALQEFGVS